MQVLKIRKHEECLDGNYSYDSAACYSSVSCTSSAEYDKW